MPAGVARPAAMLLYTRLAAPRAPKRRSRAGCTHCKEKKKKCDERQPHCSRCAEQELDCVYEPVKPRQHRTRDSAVSDGPSGRLAVSKSQTAGRALVLPLALCGAGGLSPSDESASASSVAADTPPRRSPIGSVPGDLPLEREGEGESGDETARRAPGGPAAAAAGMVVEAVVRSAPASAGQAAKAPAPRRRAAPSLLDFCAPAFGEFSDRPNRRALVDHFCSVLSHLIVFREESGNPFQQLVLPLTATSSPVTNAIYALASAHLEYRGVANPEKSLYFHNQAIQGLAKLIEHDGKVDRNELLAAIMLLVYYEVLVQKGRSNIVDGHLKGALTIMVSNPEPCDPTAIFLERAFRFYDVIAALSSGTAPLSIAPAAGCLVPLPPLGAPAASPLSNVDTLLGMATTLWPAIHRLASLLPLKTELEAALRTSPVSPKAAALQAELQAAAEAIETALKQWTPCLPPGYSVDEKDCSKVVVGADGHGDEAVAAAEKGRIHSIFNNALAYRHSALVYLYRTVYGHRRGHGLVQAHAHLSLTHCVATVWHAGPMGALLWPLFVAACEAASAGDRELASQAFVAVDKRQGMMNIERAWHIVREVWRRADLIKEEEEEERATATTSVPTAPCGPAVSGERGVELWRSVSQDWGISVIFG